MRKKENINEKVGKKETYKERIKRNIFTYVCVLYTSIIQHDKCKVSYYSITIFYYNM